MTLSIYVYYTDTQTGERKYVDLGLGGDLAGVEAARHELWGAAVIDELGLKLFPLLKSQNIHVSGAELDALEWEVQTILANIPKIDAQTHFGADTISHRTQNILKAIAKAREVDGWVSII